MTDSVITIKDEHIIENVINKSRFIAHIKPVQDESEAKAFIETKKKEHREATHNCSAYTIGDTMLIQKANDDGEPSGTAGVPMLEMLKKLEVHNAAVVVTRYFGGIKLGTGGLIRAYGGAVRDVIQDIGRVTLKPAIPTRLSIAYELTGKFEHELQSTNFILRDTNYTDQVTYHIDVLEEDYDAYIQFVNQHTQGKFTMEEDPVKRLPFDID
ncbi:ABC transporter [Staphylococcus schleiferi]|uniref:YigZ family protein n=1 Tax=Staphylococcus coagulans TaxID=74706 RepID=A0ABU1EXY6_9STAP|nr:YigZ family protein [Staphylococcus coagulans]AKS67674.1 ABC transporter [Staphylococcus schleiferi]AKS69852.1 ABC transporter [Staphylococcus schleiferi]AKS71971.1 ABC transporter [Staphylococcus schleiferi]AKS74258.1 ABC transporter [Staphylococcus schleiferi]MBA8759566.1 YigZ family protein [Staphylococcus coagulans]